MVVVIMAWFKPLVSICALCAYVLVSACVEVLVRGFVCKCCPACCKCLCGCAVCGVGETFTSVWLCLGAHGYFLPGRPCSNLTSVCGVYYRACRSGLNTLTVVFDGLAALTAQLSPGPLPSALPVLILSALGPSIHNSSIIIRLR